jgi:hypothetical protein
MKVIKVLSSKVGEGGRRFIKFLSMGSDDTRENVLAAPFGDDSNPPKDFKAIYTRTSVDGEDVVVGIINENAIAEPGEKRLYSTNDDGDEQFYLYLRKNGTIEIGGDQGNAVRYQELQQQFDELNNKFNDLVTAFNTHQHTGNMGAPTAPLPGFIPSQPSSADITQCKIDEIKTI